MGLNREAVLLVLMVSSTALCGVVMCYETEMYTVGDTAGWTNSGIVDYSKWASSKTIYVGDTLIFTYDEGLDDVILVGANSFDTCNTTEPLRTFTSGFDALEPAYPGAYFFTSDFPGHCEAGQKIRIHAYPRPAMGPIENMPPSAAAPSPTQRSAASSTILI